MTYRGKIQNGMVVLEGSDAPPEGTTVSVRVPKTAARRRGKKSIPTLYDGLKRFIGMANDLPPDASLNVDHYLYGAPKRK